MIDLHGVFEEPMPIAADTAPERGAAVLLWLLVTSALEGDVEGAARLTRQLQSWVDDKTLMSCPWLDHNNDLHVGFRPYEMTDDGGFLVRNPPPWEPDDSVLSNMRTITQPPRIVVQKCRRRPLGKRWRRGR